jgi:valyl-tRNA synthetase
MGKASRRKSEKKETTATSQKVLDNALNAIQTIAGNKTINIRRNLPQAEKISNALSELLGYEVSKDAPLEEYKTALAFIVIAWNISLLNTHEQSAAIEKVIKSSGTADTSILSNVRIHLKRIIALKQALFPHDKRLVVSSDVRFEGNSFGVTAAALVQ